MKTNSKISVLIFIIGLMCVSFGVYYSFFKKDNSTNTDENLIVNLNPVYQETDNISVNKFESQNYSLATVNGGDNHKYSFAILNDTVLEQSNWSVSLYSNDKLSIKCDSNNADNYEDIVKSLYDDYHNQGYSVSLFTGDYNYIKILLFKLKKENEYKEVLSLKVLNENNYYNNFTYEIVNHSFENRFINKIISSLKQEDKDEKDNNCSINDGKVICNYDDIKLTYDFNQEKYSINNNRSLNNSVSIFNDSNGLSIKVMMYYNKNDITKYMEENYIYDCVYQEKTFSNKKVLQFVSDNFYNNIHYLDNHHALVIEVYSKTPIDNIVNDFMNYTIV